MDKHKRFLLVTVILINMLAGAGSAGTVYYYFFSRQFNLSKTAYIYIDRDDNLESIYSKIESTGHPKTMYGFKFQAERGNYGEKRMERLLLIISHYRSWLTDKIKIETERFILSNLGGVLIHFLLRV